MAKYEVKCSCGHMETFYFIGPMKERYKKIEYFEKEGVCRKCWEQEQNELAMAWEEDNNMPSIEGTEKQVMWARRIRKDIFSDFSKLVKNTNQIIGIKFWAWIKTKQEANWWINHKDMTIRKIAKEWKEETGINIQEMK